MTYIRISVAFAKFVTSIGIIRCIVPESSNMKVSKKFSRIKLQVRFN